MSAISPPANHKDFALPNLGLEDFDYESFLSAVLAEDLGDGGDITSQAIASADVCFRGAMVSREPLVVAALPLAAQCFRMLDANITIDILVGEGQKVAADTRLMTLSGAGLAILAAERAALNIVQHCAAIATTTRAYVDAIADSGAVLLDTRKTTPLLRVLEKYSVRMGGGQNHRMRLDDVAMIKDNHIALAGSVAAAIRAVRAANIAEVIVEVDHIEQIDSAIEAGASRLLLDNMVDAHGDASGYARLRAAVAQIAGRVPCEASGGVTLQNIRAIADCGVDYISVGKLTQAAGTVDIALDYL